MSCMECFPSFIRRSGAGAVPPHATIHELFATAGCGGSPPPQHDPHSSGYVFGSFVQDSREILTEWRIALRESKDILENTMAVFLNEPLLDWSRHARRVAMSMGANEGASR